VQQYIMNKMTLTGKVGMTVYENRKHGSPCLFCYLIHLVRSRGPCQGTMR
jgi:hypothetical protein